MFYSLLALPFGSSCVSLFNLVVEFVSFLCDLMSLDVYVFVFELCYP